jgi:hypothetical protein
MGSGNLWKQTSVHSLAAMPPVPRYARMTGTIDADWFDLDRFVSA